MRVIVNRIIPFINFVSMAFWPFIFVRKENIARFTKPVERHEDAHCEQQLEVLIIALVLTGILAYLGCGYWSLFMLPLYYYIYYLEWAIKSIILRDMHKGYMSISHEVDARISEYNEDYYGKTRKMYAWVKFITYLEKE